jgi:prepilin-type N-terminal cleavage/methylation domain-containing protein
VNNRGVTLLELLVAVSLLSLLTTGLLLAMRLGFNAMNTTNAQLLDNRRMLSVQRILEQQIAGLMPVVAECLAKPGLPPEAMPFFQGAPTSMRFVSSYSLGEAWRGYPRILELQVIPGEEGRGVRLVVNEHLYTGPRSAGSFCLGAIPDPSLGGWAPGFLPIQVGPDSFVLADKLAYCRFIYRETLLPPALARWMPVWPKMGWPSAVRIEMAPLEAARARLPLVSITAPIRVNKVPFNEYADY